MKSSSAPETSVIRHILRRDTFGPVGLITLAAPAARNTLSNAMMEALTSHLDEFAKNADVRCLVLAAEGPAFCAGHDLREITAARTSPDGGRSAFDALMARCSALMVQITRMPQPVIAAVEGVATAAGCQLVAACDLAVAGGAASFCTPGVDIGLFCSTPAVALGRNVARKHAMEMLLTGERIDARRARDIGLVNRVVASGEALASALQLGDLIAGKSAGAIRAGKKTFYEQNDMPLADAYAHAGRAMVENLLNADAREGIDAFLKKRTPRWRPDEPR